jgi:hypothetical protein
VKHDIGLIAKLLNKSPEDILQSSLACYVEHSLASDLRRTYLDFINAVSRTSPAHVEHEVAKRYRVAPKVQGMNFNPNKTRGRLVAALKQRHDFVREDFRQVVAEVMSWKPATATFGISTKFATLDDADRAWWGTLKGRDKLIEGSL